jgi:hypothetical protein
VRSALPSRWIRIARSRPSSEPPPRSLVSPSHSLGGNYIAPEGVRRLEGALGLTARLANGRPISSWLGSSPLTPLLLNRHSAYLRRLSHATGTPQLSRGNSFAATPRSGTLSRGNSNGQLSRGNSFTNTAGTAVRVNSARGSFKDFSIPRLSTTPRTDSAASPWVPLSPNHEAMKNRLPSQRTLRNTITGDSQSRRQSTQFFESAFTGGATDDFLTKRSNLSANSQQPPTQQQLGAMSARRRNSNLPQLSTGASSTVVPPLLSTSILPPSLQGTLATISSPIAPAPSKAKRR